MLVLAWLAHVRFSFLAQARICMTCNMFMNGRCVEGEGKCTIEEGGACSTMDIYLFSGRGNVYREPQRALQGSDVSCGGVGLMWVAKTLMH